MSGSITFRRLAELCERLSGTPSRRQKVKMLAEFLSCLAPEEAEFASRFIIGRPVPAGEEDRLEVGYATLLELTKRRGKQELLLKESLMLKDVMEAMDKIRALSGYGSRQARVMLLEGLLSRAEQLESKWLLKGLIGEMQHGVNEGLLQEAVAEMTGLDLEAVKRADMFHGDMGELVRSVGERGREGITSATLSLFRPVKPMLAEMCYSIPEALSEHGGSTFLEYKLDGARIQVHTDGDSVRVFSRRLKEITESVPDVVDTIKDSMGPRPTILDGEAIAVGKDGKPLPFQDLMRRFTRIKDVREAVESVPLKVYLFDILMVDGRLLIDMPCQERWAVLQDMVRPEVLMKRVLVSGVKEAGDFMEEAIEMGHEGIMAKHPRSVYAPGSRGRRWLKLKQSMTLDLVIVAADWGHGRRKGWLSNYHLAVLDEEGGRFEVVGKTFKGLTDEEFKEMTRRLLELRVAEDGYTVYVKPSIVVEVAFNEVQRSSQYPSGYALRFARVVRIRDDKRPDEVDSLSMLRRVYDAQLRRKGST